MATPICTPAWSVSVRQIHSVLRTTQRMMTMIDPMTRPTRRARDRGRRPELENRERCSGWIGGQSQHQPDKGSNDSHASRTEQDCPPE